MSNQLGPKKTYAKPEASEGAAASVVSPEAHHRVDHVHHDSPLEKGKVKHAAQLLPEELEHTNDKKRSAATTDTNKEALVTPPPTKRRRTAAVTIQRSPPTKGDETTTKIPSPPASQPPEPTKYMKVLLLGPPAQGKTGWIQGLNPTDPPSTDAATAPTTPFMTEYHSKDYSFESSFSDTPETVRLQLYSTDCVVDENPPASWHRSLLPQMQHTVLVLDLFQAPDAREALRAWKAWWEQHIAATTNIPVSLVLVDDRGVHTKKNQRPNMGVPPWTRLRATVETICQGWNVNTWYLTEPPDSVSSDVILQTMIERTWSVEQQGRAE